jgi:hypothetical protein
VLKKTREPNTPLDIMEWFLCITLRSMRAMFCGIIEENGDLIEMKLTLYLMLAVVNLWKVHLVIKS